jgi:uncharacterized membrane protein YccC
MRSSKVAEPDAGSGEASPKTYFSPIMNGGRIGATFRALSRKFFQRLLARDPLAVHYAVRIFLGTAFLWILLQRLGDNHAIWAIITMVFITEPKIQNALESFRLRIYNTFVGCGIALIALVIAGSQAWILPIGVTLAVLLSTRAPESPASWRTTPVAAGVVLTAGLSAKSSSVGLHIALIRAGEVLLGGATAIVIAWVMSRVWMPQDEN